MATGAGTRAANRPGYGYGRQKNGIQTASPVYHTGRYEAEIQRRRFGYGWHTAAYGRLTGVYGKQIQIQFLLKKRAEEVLRAILNVYVYIFPSFGAPAHCIILESTRYADLSART